MAEGSAATAAAASAPGLRAGGRGGGRPWGRKAEGGRRRAGGRAGGEGAGGGGKGRARRRRRRASPPPRLGAPRARSAAARPGAPPRRASAARSGRASSRPPGRRSASPFLLRLRLLPHKYQLLTPSPDLAAAAAATLRSGSASRDFRAGLGPPRLAPTRPLALSLLPLCQSICPFAAVAPPTHPGSSRIGVDGAAPARAGWPRRVTSARRHRPPPRVARLPPSAVQQQRDPPPRARAALGSGASPLQPPPREPVSGARSPAPRGRGPAGEGGVGRTRGLGRPAARRTRGGAGGARGAAPAPNKVCFDEKRLCLLFRVGWRLLSAPGSGRAMAATRKPWLITSVFSIPSCFCLIKLHPWINPPLSLRFWNPGTHCRRHRSCLFIFEKV
ncbi:translation initiation factor IF-2-like isoform X2 [Prionailurus viverrinus]|uniref:translation initiation factor IF-2-like isoform X2 n=1 Tax=Prionailurus viverrinus TaxID=61388 RepID=UPI001FF22EEF|nr:translation initiation factor IF-2-like isoform X2 [Prionailurus viverrinus]